MTPRKSAVRRGAGDVKVRVRRRNLNDNYTITPNDLPRGHGVYACLEPLERLWLAAGLSCANDWETTLAEIESWIPMGRNRHEDMRRKLREEGFLTMDKDRHPAGAVDEEGKSIGGQIMWVYEFHMDPLPPGERDELPEKKAKPDRRRQPDTPPASPDTSMPRNPGHGPDADETAGQAMPPKSGPGQPGHGQPGPGGAGVTPYIEKNQGEEEPPPLTPHDQPPAPSSRQPEPGGDSPSGDEPRLADIVAWFARRTTWEPDAVEDALTVCVERDLGSLTEVAQALRDVADGKYDAVEGPTSSPRRLYALPNAPWWSDVRARRAAAAAAARAAGPRCSVKGHERELADGCPICKVEAIGDDWQTKAEVHPRVKGDPERWLRRVPPARRSAQVGSESVAS